MKILVLSCDKNADLFPIFRHCIEKYWPDHPEIIYSTESVINPFYKTICFNYDIEKWTKRLHNTVLKIDDDYIITMVDDIFIQSKVDTNRIESLTKYFDNNTACINLQPTGFDKEDIPYKDDLLLRSPQGKYKISMMCGLWKKDKLLSVSDYSTNPWQFEWDNKHKGYTYLITKTGNYINWGFSNSNWRFGLHEGKWFRESIKFLKSEKLDIDFSKRGCLNLKCVFGIVSYLPSDAEARKSRIKRLENLFNQLGTYWKDIPIIIISQNWKNYNPVLKNKVFRYSYEPLGILKARNTLRTHFLNSDFDYLIMFDDDAIIQCDTPEASEDYIKIINKHPDGFCFIKGGNGKYNPYADSQLNLCAISRWIYEHEPIPNIDPQKSEGFEDRIWSTLLHFKYPDKEFDAPKTIRCIHFKNPNIDKFGGEVISTWAGEKEYKWKYMRAKTLEIESYIAEHKDLPKDKSCDSSPAAIDLVVPYVDSSDENWHKLFLENTPNLNKEDVDAIGRFRGQGDFFRFFFRCINKNMPWIRKIHLLVQSNSQVPSWVDQENVHVVLHEQFIPKEFLPTFNSTTIEMFLWNIPGLSEKFIYSNDDIFVVNSIDKSQLFSNTNCYSYCYEVSRLDTTYGHHIDNGYKLVYGYLGETSKTVSHTIRPYYKSIMVECYNKFKDIIHSSISNFRDNKNLNIYLYDFYQYFVGKSSSEKKFDTITLSDKKVDKLIKTFGVKCSTVCLQDSGSEECIYNNQLLIDWFKEHFKNKCRYELKDIYSGLTQEKLDKIESIVSKVPESKREGFRKVLMRSWSL